MEVWQRLPGCLMGCTVTPLDPVSLSSKIVLLEPHLLKCGPASPLEKRLLGARERLSMQRACCRPNLPWIKDWGLCA